MEPRPENRLMVVRLTLSQWYPRKYDPAVSREIATMHGASDRADEVGRYNKILVELSSIKPLQHEFGMLRGRHYDMTAPWSDRGERVLPVELYFAYVEMLGGFVSRISELADEFCNVEYSKQREAARVRLGSMFREEDYPPPERVRERFGVEYKFEPLPDPTTARAFLLIPDDMRAKIEADVVSTQARALDDAHRHVIDTLLTRATEFVQKVRNFDQGDTRVLYATAVENLRDVAKLVVDGLNIQGDPELKRVAEGLHSTLDGVVVEHLRLSKATRVQKASEVDELVKKFAGAFGGWERK